MISRDKKKIGAISFAVVIAISLLYMNRARIFGYVFGRGFEVSAESLFDHEFETSPSEVSGLAGAGSMWLEHYDAWIRFETKNPVQTKARFVLAPSPIENAPIGFFEAVFPGDKKVLRDTANLDAALSLSDDGLTRCHLVNRKHNVHFYRVWREQ